MHWAVWIGCFNALPNLDNFACFFVVGDFFKINFFEKFSHVYHQHIRQFGFRSGPTKLVWVGLPGRVISCQPCICSPSLLVNPFKPNGISHSYQLDQTISGLRVVVWHFSFLFKF